MLLFIGTATEIHMDRQEHCAKKAGPTSLTTMTPSPNKNNIQGRMNGTHENQSYKCYGGLN